MRKKLLEFAGALLALTAALCLAPGSATCAFAQTYDLADGSVTVKASGNKQYVNDVEQTSDIVIGQTGSDTTSTANTITVETESGQTAEVTLSGVNIDVSGADKAAMSTSGEGDVTVTLDGQNVLRSGIFHAGLEKNSIGNLTITAEDTDQSLYAAGGRDSAGIGGGAAGNGTGITVAGGKVTAKGGGGGQGGAGIGGGGYGNGTGIAISGGEVTAVGGAGNGGGAGIGGGGDSCTGSDITVTGGKVTATGGIGTQSGAGIGGGGMRGSGSHITISGGEVAAAGGKGADGDGAGVGGGVSGFSGAIKVQNTARLKVGRGGTGSSPDICGLDADGWIKYYAADADMATATPTVTVNGPGGHDWGEAVYAWSEDHLGCTAARTCSRSAEHVETETATATAEVTQKQSCTSDELTTYTATFANAAFATQTAKGVKTADADPGKHDWGEATYAWSKDHSSCTATRTCKNDAGHVDTEKATATAEVTQKRSCTDDELTAYTATFENEAFATQAAENVKTASATGHDFTTETPEAAYLKSAATCTEKAIYYKSCSACGLSSEGTEGETTFEYGKPLDHDWDEVTYSWSKDHSTCTATRTCKRDTGHIESETVNAVATVTQERSCTADELTTYTATFKNAAFATQTVEDVKTASATGHAWGEATYTWSDDHSTCTAKRTCKNDASHVETERAAATAQVTQKQSCTDDELTTYTATFENAAFSAQKAENVKTKPASGHTPVTVPAVAATCTVDGLTEGSKCSVCGVVLTEQTVVKAAGHKGGTATCSAKAKCSVCGAEYGELNPSNHPHLTHISAKAATTTAEGNTEYWHCDGCDKYYSDAVATKQVKKSDTVVAKVAEAKASTSTSKTAQAKAKAALPTTGDAVGAAQTAALLAGGASAIGAALLVKKRRS